MKNSIVLLFMAHIWLHYPLIPIDLTRILSLTLFKTISLQGIYFLDTASTSGSKPDELIIFYGILVHYSH